MMKISNDRELMVVGIIGVLVGIFYLLMSLNIQGGFLLLVSVLTLGKYAHSIRKKRKQKE